MKNKAREYRFRTHKTEIINLIENNGRSFSKNIEDVLSDFLNTNTKIEYLERENSILQQHIDMLKSIIDSGQNEQVIPKKQTPTKVKDIPISVIVKPEPEPINMEEDVKDKLKNMFDD